MISAALVAALALASQLQTHPTGLPSIGPSRANSLRTAPIMDKLYEQAGKPALDFDFARYKDLHDNASGATSLINFSRSAAQSPGTYVGSDGLIHDAAVNLALYSEQFNVSWANSNSSDKANQAIAPDGKQTADKVIPNSGTVVNAGIYQFPYPSTDAEIRTFSVYAKSAEFSKFVIKIGGGDAVLPIALFNLQNGQIESVQDGSAKIENAGNGWFRVSLTFANSSSQFVPNMMACNDECAVGNRDVTITGDGTSGLYIWGAQLEETDPATMQPTAYIHTTSQALAAPRFDHDPVTGESLGLLVEEARANLVTSSAVAPFGMSNIYTNTIDPCSVAAPDGTSECREISVAVNPSSRLEKSFTVTSGATYAITYYSRKIAGTLADDLFPLSAFNFVNGTVTQNFTAEDAGNGWYRHTALFTTSSTSVTVRLYWQTSITASDVYAVWGLQIEAGSFPTSYIPTTGTSQTRYADVAVIEGTDFSSFYNATEGTLYAIASSAGTGTRGIAGIDDGTANERIELQTDGTDPEFVVIDGGAGSTLDTGAITAYTFFNLAGAYKHNDLAATVGGLAVQTATDTVPTVDRMRIGALQASGTYLNGHIRRLTYWPRRQADSTLQVITQ